MATFAYGREGPGAPMLTSFSQVLPLQVLACSSTRDVAMVASDSSVVMYQEGATVGSIITSDGFHPVAATILPNGHALVLGSQKGDSSVGKMAFAYDGLMYYLSNPQMQINGQAVSIDAPMTAAHACSDTDWWLAARGAIYRVDQTAGPSATKRYELVDNDDIVAIEASDDCQQVLAIGRRRAYWFADERWVPIRAPAGVSFTRGSWAGGRFFAIAGTQGAFQLTFTP